MRSDTPTARWPDPRRLGAGLDRTDAAEDLLDFVRLTWRAIEATRPLVEGWVLGAMCEHLTAVSDGEIPRLLINAPPGFMKSLLVDCSGRPGNGGHAIGRRCAISASPIPRS